MFGDEMIKTVIVTNTGIEVTSEDDGMTLGSKSSENSVEIAIELATWIWICDESQSGC